MSAWQPSAEHEFASAATSSSRPQARQSRDRVVGLPQRLQVIERYSYHGVAYKLSWLRTGADALGVGAPRRDPFFRGLGPASGAPVPYKTVASLKQ